LEKTRTFGTTLKQLLKSPGTLNGSEFAIAIAWGAKRFVYVLTAGDTVAHYYVGLTSDVDRRLLWHNSGRCTHTAKHRPWRVHVVVEFPDEPRAARFESYLKSGSGRAFAKRHFDAALGDGTPPSRPDAVEAD